MIVLAIFAGSLAVFGAALLFLEWRGLIDYSEPTSTSGSALIELYLIMLLTVVGYGLLIEPFVRLFLEFLDKLAKG